MRKYVIGALIGFTLALATNAFAAVGDKVEAVFAEFTYMVNGEEKTMDTPVLVYDGNSYLRTTQVSNLLGYDVTYKADSRTIEFSGTLPASSSEPSTSPEPSTEPSTTPTGEPTSTESPNGSEAPTESAEPSGSSAPIESPAPSTSPEPSEEVTESVDDAEHLAACQAIRDDYGYQIAMLSYSDLKPGPLLQEKLNLEYARDQELAAEGC